MLTRVVAVGFGARVGLALRCYTDGGCDGNGAKGIWGAAGWGAHILAVNVEGEKEKIEAELWGPVETDPGSPWWCGAQRGTNNTGELIGIGQAGTNLASGYR